MSLNITNVDGTMSVNSAILMPIGSVICHASSSAPDGWLVCDGGSYLRSEYQALFNAIDVTYGSVDDSHFNVPNLSDRGPIGVGNFSCGSFGGNDSVTLSTDNLPTHNHTGATYSSGSHSHTSNAVGGNTGLCIIDGYGTPGSIDNSNNGEINCQTTQALTISSSGDHTHSFTTNSTGSGTSFGIRNPYVVLNYIIKC